MSGFFALLDDIASLAKLTMSTVDDTAAMAVKTSAKVSAAAVDDVAATPQYVTGITPDREIPIIARIARGSLRNKLLIILPIALVLTWLAPGVLPYALIAGGTYLCFEGGEKILERLRGEDGEEEEEGLDENAIVRRAIITDLVLSTEIMLLALADVENESSVNRVVALVIIAFIMTFAVYGVVALLIKLDDAGARLARRGHTSGARRLGRAVVSSAPGLFRGIGVVGTVAMLWVGGQILAHNLHEVGFTPPYALIEHVGALSAQPVLHWVLETAADCVFGAVVGCVLAGAALLIARARR